jgi:hypothetical protein
MEVQNQTKSTVYRYVLVAKNKGCVTVNGLNLKLAWLLLGRSMLSAWETFPFGNWYFKKNPPAKYTEHTNVLQTRESPYYCLQDGESCCRYESE